MARYGWLLGIAFVALASSRASADLRASVTAVSDKPIVSVESGRHAAMPQSLSTSFVVAPSLVAELPVAGSVSAVDGQAWVAPPELVLELPPAPGSAALFLSAMVSLGAWQLVRSGRDMHLGSMPEWYHTGAPAQVGHTTVFDLEYSGSSLCCFEQPAGERPFLYRVRREQAPRCDARGFLISAAPRGPPCLG